MKNQHMLMKLSKRKVTLKLQIMNMIMFKLQKDKVELEFLFMINKLTNGCYMQYILGVLIVILTVE